MATKLTVIYKIERRVQDFDTPEIRIGMARLLVLKTQTVEEALCKVIVDQAPFILFAFQGWPEMFDPDNPA